MFDLFGTPDEPTRRKMIPANRSTIPVQESLFDLTIDERPVHTQLWSRAPGTSMWWAVSETPTGHEMSGALLVRETPAGWIPQLRPDAWTLGTDTVALVVPVAEKWPVTAEPIAEPPCPYGTVLMTV